MDRERRVNSLQYRDALGRGAGQVSSLFSPFCFLFPFPLGFLLALIARLLRLAPADLAVGFALRFDVALRLAMRLRFASFTRLALAGNAAFALLAGGVLRFDVAFCLALRLRFASFTRLDLAGNAAFVVLEGCALLRSCFAVPFLRRQPDFDFDFDFSLPSPVVVAPCLRPSLNSDQGLRFAEPALYVLGRFPRRFQAARRGDPLWTKRGALSRVAR